MSTAYDGLRADPVASSPDRGRRLPCTADPSLWFSDRPDEVEAAKAICLACPVQQSCLAGAIGRGEPCGVWGGQLLDHGRVVPRKRGRGRPRKTDRAA